MARIEYLGVIVNGAKEKQIDSLKKSFGDSLISKHHLSINSDSRERHGWSL